MSDFQEYRHRQTVSARRLEEDETVFTKNGAEYGREGQYLVHVPNDGVYLVGGEYFEEHYELIPESVSEARKFTPEGKTVEQVLEFMREHPEEIDRVKKLEAKGVGRKGIMEYAVR
jgi:hypothetical protein